MVTQVESKLPEKRVKEQLSKREVSLSTKLLQTTKELFVQQPEMSALLLLQLLLTPDVVTTGPTLESGGLHPCYQRLMRAST